MATGLTHQITGTASGALVAAAAFHLGLDLVACSSIIAGSAVGAKAPDYLEGRAIKHRTVTHWWVIWVGLVAFGVHAITHGAAPVGALMLGFGAGGLTHLLFDLPNPMGVPFLTPYRRVSLRWWRSGQHEWLIVPAWLAITLYPAFQLFN